MIAHLISTVERLEQDLDRSIEAMTNGADIDDDAMVKAKSHALLALNRLTSEIASTDATEEARAAASRLRDKLTLEASLLERRLDASRVVVEIIENAMVSDDWDGTYSLAPALLAGQVASQQ